MPHTEFQQLAEIHALVGKGRKAAARTIWDRLSVEFRKAVLEFILYSRKYSEHVCTCPTVPMTSHFGYFCLSKEWVLETDRALNLILGG